MLSKVFKAYDIRSTYPDPLNEDLTRKIGVAAARYLKNQVTGRDASDPMMNHIVVGRDMRTSSPSLSAALIEGIGMAGVNVIDVGQCDTSFIYFAINHLGCCGGVMNTASHNPPQYNGFKISGLQARPIGKDTGLVDIQRIAATIDPDSMQSTGQSDQRDLWADYARHVLQFLKLDRPLKVVVDASNGMAGLSVPKVFGGAANLEIIPINFEVGGVNGRFAHDPNPLVPENMRQTREGVKEHGADFGVCFDGDADRCMVVDETGAIVGCDHLGALLAKYFLADHAGSAIAYDLRSTKALSEAIEGAGGKPCRSKVGHVFMKKVMKDNDAVFGAELSGHMYFRDNWYTDSGLITFATVATVLGAAGQPLSGLLAPYRKYPQSGEINFQVEDKDGMIAEIRAAYADIAEMDDLDGITVDAFAKAGWWANIRKSNTEPLLRLNLEARDQPTLDKVLAELKERLGEPAEGH